MLLLADPYSIFKNSKTPAGLYARQKWLGQENSKEWQIDFNETVDKIVSNQLSDGSWKHSPILTIDCLFSLHLTVRAQKPFIDRGLEWLINLCVNDFPKKQINPEWEMSKSILNRLPFQKACFGYLLCSATLFLSSIFGKSKDSRILKLYEKLDNLGVKNDGRWCGWKCSSNILRAFIVHPHYCLSPSVGLFIESLGKIQDHSGKWQRGVSFYQTLNALAHLDGFEVDRQLEKAFKRIPHLQNRDGTWGAKGSEWNTFLVIHALKNKGFL